MPLRLDIKRKLVQRSDRVKGVDLHPVEPWILANLYSGNVFIWNHQTNSLVKSFDVTELPVRTAKWCLRKQWIVCGSDDMFIRVYNYNTSELIKAFEAHTDYIRAVCVHPTQPFVLSCSDDMLIKLWSWEKDWDCVQIFEGHSHYVMQACFNPKDTNTFASASLDRTVKVWSIGQPTPNFTLEGHEKGVNCVDYFTGGDRPYLISGADDKLVKIWDYQTKTCVQTLDGHSHNVSAVAFHPELPIIITGSEDGTLRIWHQTTYRLENTLNYGLERVWAIGVIKGSNAVSVGYDEGTVMFKIGREDPVASMDASGKIVYAKHNEVQTVNVKALPQDYEIADGERLPLASKEFGSCDLYPQSIEHNPNGRFITACGDGEYIIYTALAWRNKSFGAALEFGWSADSSEYAIRESPSKIKIFKNFKEKLEFRPHFAAEGLHGGALLGLRSTDFICFYDWEQANVIQRIDATVRDVKWSESGEMCCIISETSFYILRYDPNVVAAAFESGEFDEGEGVEDSFELLAEISETVLTGIWVGDCFVYNNGDMRLNYVIGGEVTTLFHLDRPMYLLGYLAAQSRLYLIDKEFSVITYTMLLSVIEFKTLVLRGELEAAEELLTSIPKEHHNSVARFLEARGLVADALRVATDPDFKFELAVQLGELGIAKEIIESYADDVGEGKWKQLGELAMSTGDLELAAACLDRSGDLSGQLLLASAAANPKQLLQLSEVAKSKGKNNVAFVCLFSLGDIDGCLDLLVETGRVPEAAFMARTYAPSRVSEIVQLWKSDLSKINKKAAEALADPAEFANLFPNFDEALALEEEVRKQRMSSKRPSASAYGGEKELAKHVEESATIADEVEEAPPTPPRAQAAAAVEQQQEEDDDDDEEEEVVEEETDTNEANEEEEEEPIKKEIPAPKIPAPKAATPPASPKPPPIEQEDVAVDEDFVDADEVEVEAEADDDWIDEEEQK
jgi:coatomer subunit beta'